MRESPKGAVKLNVVFISCSDKEGLCGGDSDIIESRKKNVPTDKCAAWVLSWTYWKIDFSSFESVKRAFLGFSLISMSWFDTAVKKLGFPTIELFVKVSLCTNYTDKPN